MWASNAKDNLNENMWTEWRPGSVLQIYLPKTRGPGIMKRTKHNDVHRMMAGKVQDYRVNTDIFPEWQEWRPGILKTKRHETR